MIKKLLLCASIWAFCTTMQAQQLRTPAPSPAQTIKQDFGLSTIELNYSRPGMKGRKVYGDLVPFGKVWRTGANSATTLTFADEVIIGGTKVPAGKYGLLSIPDKDNWTLIITKQTDVTSPAAYKQEMDVVRISAKPEALPTSSETFTMQFLNVKPTSVDLSIVWDKTQVRLPISTDVDSKVMSQIKSAMERDSRPYFQAAMYYLETDRDLNQALTWFDKAIEQSPNAFWVYHQKANALAKLGKKEEAKQTANKSIELAKAQKNDDYVKLNEKLLSSLK
jgi:tetratricopeptide (TPR) repeat protein